MINTCGNTHTKAVFLLCCCYYVLYTSSWCSKVYEYSTPRKINMEHNHGGLVQIIFLSFSWVICRFQPLVFQGVNVLSCTIWTISSSSFFQINFYWFKLFGSPPFRWTLWNPHPFIAGCIGAAAFQFQCRSRKSWEHPSIFLLIQQENLENPPYVWSLVSICLGLSWGPWAIDFPKVGQIQQSSQRRKSGLKVDKGGS